MVGYYNKMFEHELNEFSIKEYTITHVKFEN